MGALTLPVEALLFDADWLAPASSMRHLLSKLPAGGQLSHDASANQAVQFRRSIGKASGDAQAMQDVMPGLWPWKTSCARMPLFPVRRTDAGPDIADLLVMVHRVVNRRRQAQVAR